MCVLELRCGIGDGAGLAVVCGAAVAAPAGRMVRSCEVKRISRVPTLTSARRRFDEGVRVRVGPADGRRRLLGGLRAPSGHIHTIMRPRGRLMGLSVCARRAGEWCGRWERARDVNSILMTRI